MPVTPYPISGTVTKVTGTVMTSGNVVFRNYTQGGTGFKCAIQSDGDYLGDMGNFSEGWTVGDVIWYKVESSTYMAYGSFTVVDADTKTLDITTYGINQYLFRELYDIINDNKSTAWTVTASMPNDIADFPVVIIDSISTNINSIDITKTNFEIPFSVDIMYYAKNKVGAVTYGKGYLDLERDITIDTISSNKTLLNFKGIYLQESWIDNSNTDSIEMSGQKVNAALQTLSMKLVK